jgi:hypothetical protein
MGSNQGMEQDIFDLNRRQLLSFFSFYFVCCKKGNQLDRKEQACMGYCQDLYLETRAQVQAALQDRQSQM